MTTREISNLDLKVKLTKEYLDNGGYEKIYFIDLLKDLKKVKVSDLGKVDPNTVSTTVNAFMLTILADQLQPPYFSTTHISEYQSTLQKSNSFDQDNIDTVEQFENIYQEYSAKSNFLFRGQREAKWRLYSTLQRQWIMGKLFAKDEGYQQLLEKMVAFARSDFKKKILAVLGERHDDADNDIAVLGFLQHHGCPTPLLDWTYKFQHALYFGLEGLLCKDRKREIDDYFSVYFVEERNFENGGMRKLIYDSIESMQERLLSKEIAKIARDETHRKMMEEHFKGRKIIDLKRIKGSGLIAHMTQIKHMINFPGTYFSDGHREDDIPFSLNNSKNILNQAGVFTWNAEPAKPFEMVVSEQNVAANPSAEERTYVLCQCFNIAKKLAPYIKERLADDGITKELIYPTSDINTWFIFEKSIL